MSDLDRPSARSRPRTPDGHADTADAPAALARYIDERLASGAWPVGMKLPAEREIAERFALSRGTVRKVLARHVVDGRLRRAPGSGTYVAVAAAAAQASLAPAARPVNVSPAELMEARLLFEPLLPALIVRHATPQDFARLEHCLAQAERATSFAGFEHWDGELHQVLATATHNAFLVEVLNLMGKVREAGEWGHLKQRALTRQRRARYQAQHRAIVAALRERDEQAASRLIKAHLLEVQANLFAS